MGGCLLTFEAFEVFDVTTATRAVPEPLAL
jgi:hypothetical protein